MGAVFGVMVVTGTTTFFRESFLGCNLVKGSGRFLVYPAMAEIIPLASNMHNKYLMKVG